MTVVPERLAGPVLAKAGEGHFVEAKPMRRVRLGAVASPSAAAFRGSVISQPEILARRVLAFGGVTMFAALFFVWINGTSHEPRMSECRVTPSSLSLVPQVNTTIRMRGNAACAIPIANGIANDLRIKILPEHGSITIGPDWVSYRPIPKFKGRDFFVVGARDHAGRPDNTSASRIHVFVK